MYKPIKSARWFYSGDVNCENGGFWYRLDKWQYGYAEYVRITPCSDAGGPDNQFWIESGTVHSLDNADRVKQAIDSCGWIGNPDFEDASESTKRHMIVGAMLGYGFTDPGSNESVQIGKADPLHTPKGCDPITPDTVLRAGSSLANYVRRAYLRNA